MSKYEFNEKSMDAFPDHSHPTMGDQGFMAFLWNPKTGEFLGRTAMSWFKITVFYIIYYICLGLFFYSCYSIFYATTMKDTEPRWKQSDGLIGSNPGVGFRPMPSQEYVESTLIWINSKDEYIESPWAKLIDEYLKPYREASRENSTDCKFYSSNHATKDKFCYVDVDKIEGCSKLGDNFGYTHNASKPCVLIKLNKIYGWTPEPYKTLEDLEVAKERNMPNDLMENIKNLINTPNTNTNHSQLNTVWVSCDGENPGDRENIGPLSFFAPGFGGENFAGIPGFYFPYMNQEGYQPPFVFVRFENPQPHVLIQVECKAWAMNIKADRQQRQGSVHFEIILD